MAGTYTEGQSKTLSGVYTLIQAALTRLSQGSRGIVAYPFTSNWGPINSLGLVVLQTEFDKKYNAQNSGLTAAKIYTHAFKGKPLRVLPYRMATGAAAKGTATLNDSGVVMSLTLETLYESDRAFIAVVKDGVASDKVIEITEGGKLLASVKGTTAAELETELNKTDFVRVTAKGANLPDNNAGVSFAGGNNGSVATATEYSAFLTDVEADGTANAFSLDATTDESILTVAETWVKRVRDEGIYITWARGGPTGWDTTPADADTQSQAINYRGAVNVGNGVDGYTAAEMAIFIAARLASIPLNRTITDEVVDYKAVNKKLTRGERITAKEAGTVVFIQNGTVVEIDEGINTLTTPGAEESAEFGKIRVNNTIDQIAKDTEAFGDGYKKARSNTQEARQTYAATLETDYFAGLAAKEIIKSDYFYRPDQEYHGKDATATPKIDEAFFHYEITPIDSMEKVYQKAGVKF